MPPLSTFAPVNSAPGGLLRSWSWTRRRVTGPESPSSTALSCGPPTPPPALFRHAGAGSAEADRNDHTNRHVSSSEQGKSATIWLRDASRTAGTWNRRHALSGEPDELARSGRWALRDLDVEGLEGIVPRHRFDTSWFYLRPRQPPPGDGPS